MTDGYNVPLEENTHAGWSVDPYSRIKRTDPVDVTVDLEEPYVINTVVIKPCVYNNGGLFPCDYELQISEDGKSWTTVQTVKDAAGADGDRTTTVDRIVGRYVRVHITKHSETPDATGGYLSQIGELEVYGTNIGETEAETEESEVTEQPTEKATEPAEQPVTEPGTEKPETAPADTEKTAPTEAEADEATEQLLKTYLG